MRFSLLVAIAVLYPSVMVSQGVPADTVARPISLGEAVALARLNSPQGVQARGAVRLASVERTGAALSFLPNVTVSANTAWQRGQRIGQSGSLIDFTGPSKSFSDALSMNLELFDGGRRFHDLASARASVEAAEAGQITTDFQIVLAVKEQFYNVLAAREAVASASAQVAEAEQQLRAASVKLQAGAAIRSDSLRSMVQLGNAQLARIAALSSLENANASLTRLVATPYAVTAGEEPDDDLSINPDYASLAPLLADVPAARQSRAQVSASRAAGRSARSAYLPTISASFGRNGSGFDSRFGYGEQFAYSSSFRLNLSMPVFNQLNRETAAVRARIAEQQAEANLRDTELRLQQELRLILGQLRSAEQRIVVQRASVSAAEEDLDIQQQRYELNAASLLDVLQSQSQLNQARAALISARYDARVARARLQALLGRDL